MGNTFLTISMIGYMMLPVLHNELVAARRVTRKYESQFAKDGAKIGATFMVRKPPRYRVVKSVTFVAQDYQDEMVPLTITEHDQVGVQFTNDDLTLSMDDFPGRVLKPSLVPMANSVDSFILKGYKSVWNSTGTPGTVAATDTPFLDARVKLVNNAADMSQSWPMLVNPLTGSRLSSGLAARFNPQKSISGLYLKGTMGPFGGFDFFETQNAATHITGAWGGTILVDGATQSGSSILLKGATATIAAMAKEGDVVQFDGVYMVNPITKEDVGQLQDFVVTADADSSGGGALTLLISPPIILTGKNQTVTASPADGAVVYVFGTATVANVASKHSPQCLGWSEDGITLAMVDLKKPMSKNEGVEAVSVQDSDLGLSFLFMRGYDIRVYEEISRVDSLYGMVYTRPEHVARVNSGSA